MGEIFVGHTGEDEERLMEYECSQYNKLHMHTAKERDRESERNRTIPHTI